MSKIATGVGAALFCASAIAVSYSPALHAQGPSNHASWMSPADIVKLKSGQTTVTVRVEGDLSGRLTLVLRPDADGALAGTWALVDSHIEDGVGGSETLVQRGTIKGTVTGGFATFGPGGRIIGFRDLRLQITGGTLAYADITSGSGFAQGINLETRRRSAGGALLFGAPSGSLNLVF
jgi:hypothetical protein